MIEKAEKADISDIVNVIRESILSCVEDHKNDKNIIKDWLDNKTEENLTIWIKSNLAFVYKENNQIYGIILASEKGEILLNYTLPKKQGLGIGSELLSHLKSKYQKENKKGMTVESTITAKGFYLRKGFEVTKDIYEEERLVGYRMTTKATPN